MLRKRKIDRRKEKNENLKPRMICYGEKYGGNFIIYEGGTGEGYRL